MLILLNRKHYNLLKFITTLYLSLSVLSHKRYLSQIKFVLTNNPVGTGEFYYVAKFNYYKLVTKKQLCT